jgi:hypothetical protein
MSKDHRRRGRRPPDEVYQLTLPGGHRSICPPGTEDTVLVAAGTESDVVVDLTVELLRQGVGRVVRAATRPGLLSLLSSGITGRLAVISPRMCTGPKGLKRRLRKSGWARVISLDSLTTPAEVAAALGREP